MSFTLQLFSFLGWYSILLLGSSGNDRTVVGCSIFTPAILLTIPILGYTASENWHFVCSPQTLAPSPRDVCPHHNRKTQVSKWVQGMCVPPDRSGLSFGTVQVSRFQPISYGWDLIISLMTHSTEPCFYQHRALYREQLCNNFFLPKISHIYQ